MSERVKEIKYKEKTIIFLNYANLKEAEYVKVLDETMVMVDKYEDLSNRLVLIDVSDSPMTAKVLGKSSRIYSKISGSESLKVAFVGVDKVKKIIARAFSEKFYFADTIEEAKEWLVKHKSS